MTGSRKKIILTSMISPLLIAYICYEPSVAATVQISLSICYLFVFVSTISIVIKIIKTIISKIRKEDLQLDAFIRPLIAVTAGLIGVHHLQSIENTAIAYLYEKANILQSKCVANQKCPDLPEGWEKDPNFLAETTYFVGKTRYYMRYENYDNKTEFVIFINYGLGSRYCLGGGVKNNEIKQWRTH